MRYAFLIYKFFARLLFTQSSRDLTAGVAAYPATITAKFVTIAELAQKLIFIERFKGCFRKSIASSI
ncbi:MAG: hypothetical protein EOO68_26890 [Moraxellaceae bacterium]|nr:MAG: hypothetical protein EOO68_26890 [Moraxellaceae bacterium]